MLFNEPPEEPKKTGFREPPSPRMPGDARRVALGEGMNVHPHPFPTPRPTTHLCHLAVPVLHPFIRNCWPCKKEKETTDKAHLDFWEKQPTSCSTAEDYHLGSEWRHPGPCVPRRDRWPPTPGNSQLPGVRILQLFNLIFSEFQNPWPHLVFSLL